MIHDPAAAAAESIIRKAKLTAYGSADFGNALEGDFGTWDDWRALIEVELRRHYPLAARVGLGVVERLVAAASAVAQFHADPPESELEYSVTGGRLMANLLIALAAYRSLPPDPQDASAGSLATVERLVDAAESLRAEVATIVNDPSQTERPGLDDAYCRTIEALDAVRSLPPDPQDAALTAEREALLRRAVEACSHLLYSQYFGYERRDPCGLEMQLRAVLHDAARLGITGDAK